MTARQPPPTEISKTTLGAVIAAIGATFLLVASMSHSWWTGTARTQLVDTELGVGLAGLQRCSERPADIFAEGKPERETLCVRLPFGATYSKMKIPGSWAFFGRATYYLSLLSILLVVLSLGVLIGGNNLFSRISPAKLAVASSGMALLSGMVFIVLKPSLDAAFELPNVTVNASFGMFMHIFGAVAACAGSVLTVVDAPQVHQPAIHYRAGHAGVDRRGPAPANPGPAHPPRPVEHPPTRAESEPAVAPDTIPAAPPPQALIHDPKAPIALPDEAPTLAKPRPPSAAGGKPPVAFFKPEPPPTPPCKQCSGPTRYIETFRKAFCNRCEVYTRMG